MTVPSQLPLISIDGRPLRDSVKARLVEVIVDDHALLPDGFTLRFHSDDRLWGELNVSMGAEVKIKAGKLGETPADALITAEVTAIEALFESGSRYLVVRGYDKSHRLHAGRKTRSWNRVSDSDLARRIAGDVGISIGTIDRSSVIHDHISQINMTDWEFLRDRAGEIGFVLAVRDGKLSFTEESGGAGGGIGGAIGGALGVGGGLRLELDHDLLAFRPRVTGAQQVKDVTARGWDVSQKAAVQHRETASTVSVSLDQSNWKPDKLAATFGSPSYLVCDRPIRTTAEAREVAASAAEDVASSFAEADGTALGDPRLTTGSAVTIAGTGPFDGTWVLSHTHHRFDEDGYYTDFEVSGRQERSVLGLSSLGATGAGSEPIYGVVVALVTNVQDPHKLGRVKLKFPWLADDYESDWARTVHPGAANDRGFLVMPERDDEVLVMFEHGDVRAPYVIGGLYNGKDKPPTDAYCDASDGKVKIRQWRSTKGHTVEIDDNDSKDQISLYLKGGDYRIDICKKDDKILIKSKGKVVVEGMTGIELKSDNGDVTITGRSIKVDAQASLDLKGATAKLEASGTTDVKGSIVKIN